MLLMSRTVYLEEKYDTSQIFSVNPYIANNYTVYNYKYLKNCNNKKTLSKRDFLFSLFAILSNGKNFQYLGMLIHIISGIGCETLHALCKVHLRSFRDKLLYDCG